jgi:flagellar hook-associated protein 1
MGSLTALLNLTQSSLQANQAAIDITSNNVANANTPGYTEEVANWTEADSVVLSGGSSIAEGATVTGVSQRDLVLNQRINLQTQLQSSSAAESSALSDLQSVFGLTTTSTSASSTTLGSDMNAFFNSLSALQANPGDSSARQGVLSAAQTLAADFNSASSQIQQQMSGLNQQVPGVVAQVNALTASIASLNLQIQSTSPTGDAGTLEDQRQQDLTQLSQYVGFDQTKTENNGLTLTLTNGSPLVSEGKSYALGSALVNGNEDVTSSTGVDITTGLSGGKLGGVLGSLGQLQSPYLDQLDSLAYSIGSAVNAQNAAGLDANGNAGGPIFTLPATASGAAGLIGMAATNPSAIAAASVGQGATGGGNAAALMALQGQASAATNNQTSGDYFASFLTALGTSAANASSQSTVAQGSLSQLTAQQGALSGVSLDNEASNLTEYQRSYEAAAKVFSIVDALLASALNLGTETTVS